MPDDPRQCWDYIALGIEEGIIREFNYDKGSFDLAVVVEKDSLPKGLVTGVASAYKFEYRVLEESEVVAPIRAALKSWDKLPEGW